MSKVSVYLFITYFFSHHTHTHRHIHTDVVLERNFQFHIFQGTEPFSPFKLHLKMDVANPFSTDTRILECPLLGPQFSLNPRAVPDLLHILDIFSPF